MRALLALGLSFCLSAAASAQGILTHPYGGGDGTGVLTYSGNVVGGGTPTRVQGKASSNTGFTIADFPVTFTSTVGNNDAVVCFANTNNGALVLSTVTDDKGNSYHTTSGTSGFGSFPFGAYLEGVTNSPQTITFHFTAAASFYGTIVCDDFSGVATVSASDATPVSAVTYPRPGDQSGGGSGVISITSATNGDLIWLGAAQTATADSGTGTVAAGSPSTMGVNDNANAAWTEYYVQPTAGAITPTMTNSGTGSAFWQIVYALKHQ